MATTTLHCLEFPPFLSGITGIAVTHELGNLHNPFRLPLF